MESYLDLKSHIEDLIRTAELDTAFEVLKEKEYLLSSDLRAEVLLLEGRFNQLENDKNLNQINTSDYSVGLSSISKALFYVLAQEHVPAPSLNNNKKEGVILHDIPSIMPLHTFTKVVIRLSDEEEALLEDFDRSKDTVIESVRIAEVMEVHLDSEDYDAFEIRSVSGDQQFIEFGTFTEWVFKVKPLKAGTQILELRVVVLEQINDKERQRVEVLERKVQVVTDIAELTEDVFERSLHKTDIQVSTDRLQETIIERKNNPGLAGALPSRETLEKIREMQEQKMAEASASDSMPPAPSSAKKSARKKNTSKGHPSADKNRRQGNRGIAYGFFGILAMLGILRIGYLEIGSDSSTEDNLIVKDDIPIELEKDVATIDDGSQVDWNSGNMDDFLKLDPSSLGLDMVFIDEDTLGMNLEEDPQYDQLSAFYISRSAVTVAEYRMFCSDMEIQMPAEPAGGWNDSDPIVDVSWREAIDYCVWQSKQLGIIARLPTKAEWTYASRDKTTELSLQPTADNMFTEWYFDQESNPLVGSSDNIGFRLLIPSSTTW
jgi:hypothetical protein